MWHIHWPYQVYVSQWPIFYGPAILLHNVKTIWWRNVVLGIMDHCDSKIDLVKYMWISDLYFMVHWFYLISLSDKLFLYIKKWHRPGVFEPLRALALVMTVSDLFLMFLCRWQLTEHWVLLYFEVYSNSAYPQHSGERYRTIGPLISCGFVK